MSSMTPCRDAGLCSVKASIKTLSERRGNIRGCLKSALMQQKWEKGPSASPAPACHGLFLPNSAARESNLLPYSEVTVGQTRISTSGIKTALSVSCPDMYSNQKIRGLPLWYGPALIYAAHTHTLTHMRARPCEC